MGLMKQETFVCLDCESTGLDTKNDRIIEVAAVVFTLDKNLQEFQSLIDGESVITPENQKIHNISQEMLIGQPKIKTVLPDLLKMIDGYILVGHGIGFDIALIAAEADRAQIPCNILKSRSFDTLRMARMYGESPVNSLDRLRQHFNIEERGMHRAMSDVLVNIEVFRALARPYKNTEDLFRLLEKPIMLRTMPLGPHKGKKFDELPDHYLKRAEKMDFDQDLLYSLRSEIRSRSGKKKNSFDQGGNPFFKL